MDSEARVRFTQDAAEQEEEALSDAFQLMTRAMLRMKDALRLKEGRAQAAMEEALRLNEERTRERMEETTLMMERRMQEKIDVSMRSVEAKMKEAIQRMEVRMLAKEGGTLEVDEQSLSLQTSSVLVEERIEALEESVQRALVTVFPKVEALVAQLEETPPRPMLHDLSTNESESCTVASTIAPSASALQALPSDASINDDFSAPSTVPTATNTVSTTSGTDFPTSSTRSSFTRSLSSPATTTVPSPTQRDMEKELIRSANAGRIGRVSELLNAGVGINAQDDEGRTALHRAAFKGFADIASLLLRRGADVDRKESHGFTPLHFASVGDMRGVVVPLLIARRANVNAKNVAGETPLHYAASHANEAAVKTLLAKGANKSIKNILGMTPSYCASSDSVRRLLRS